MTSTLPKAIISKVLTRAILHINGDSVYASLEQSKHKKYKNKAIVVVSAQGKILSMSHEAISLGMVLSMPYKELKKLFPTAIVLVRSRKEYAPYTKKIEKIIRRYFYSIYGFIQTLRHFMKTSKII